MLKKSNWSGYTKIADWWIKVVISGSNDLYLTDLRTEWIQFRFKNADALNPILNLHCLLMGKNCLPDDGTDVLFFGKKSDKLLPVADPTHFSQMLSCSENGVYEGRFLINIQKTRGLSPVFRMAVAFLCQQTGRVMLHASGVVRNDRVWLFFGPSGVGKTTVATELNDGGVTFAVDQVVVEICDDGQILAYSTPFSDRQGDVQTMGPLVVDGLVYLEQAPTTALLPLSLHEGTRALLQESAMISRRGKSFEAALRLVDTAARRQRWIRMQFQKNVLFWKQLDAWCDRRDAEKENHDR